MQEADFVHFPTARSNENKLSALMSCFRVLAEPLYRSVSKIVFTKAELAFPWTILVHMFRSTFSSAIEHQQKGCIVKQGFEFAKVPAIFRANDGVFLFE